MRPASAAQHQRSVGQWTIFIQYLQNGKKSAPPSSGIKTRCHQLSGIYAVHFRHPPPNKEAHPGRKADIGLAMTP